MSIGSYNAFGSNLARRQNFANSSNRSYYSSIGSHTKSEHMWWNYADNGKNTVHNHRALLYSSAARGEEEIWDLSDSLADLYSRVNEENAAAANSFTIHRDHSKDVDVKKWINEDTSHGFIRVFVPNSDINTSRLIPCTLRTTAQRVCMQCGIPATSLHVQFNGDIITRMEPTDHPLAVQNEFLGNLGYSEPKKIQEQGYNNELHYLVKFYSGKPIEDNTYSKNQLSSILFVRKGKLIYQWIQRFCSISGTRLFIHRDKHPTSKKSAMQLAKGYVEEVKFKDHAHVLKLTSTLQGDRSVYLSFLSVTLYNKWLKRAQKATAKLPTKADLSKCHLEYLPEALFINEDLKTLNLRHNALRERPIEEDIYNIGWLDDLPRFYNLCTLNLANNDLKSFPLAICSIRSLVELNMASNKLEEIPSEIVELCRLQILRLHNNHLTCLPEEMGNMKRLSVVILAFNHFTTVPQVLLRLHGSSETMDSIIMAGNYIERLPGDLLSRMKLIKKIDFRMNRLTLLPSEIAKFQCLEFMTHLDIRDNNIQNLDIRALKGLVYLNCERNSMYTLQLSGVGLKYVYAGHNELKSLNITPKPEWLIDIDISHNNLTELPSWLAECFFMAKLDVSHNQLTQLPSLIFTTSKKLQELRANHNLLKELPNSVGNVVLEILQLQHNNLCSLPPTFLSNANKLKCLNLTKNFLRFLPQPNANDSLNKLQELYLTANKLQDNVFQVISCFPRLKKLHLAENIIEEIPESCIAKLEALQELNISSNCLTHLPPSLCNHPKLQVLRANSNMIYNLPDFKGAPELKVLEVGFNCLYDLSVTHLMDSQVSLLDISGNPNLFVDAAELEGLKHKKRVCMIDMRGQNRSLSQQDTQDKQMPWQSGFSQTSGMRNKLCVAILNKTKFNRTGEDALFGIFDGGKSDEVALLLADIMEETVLEELNCPLTPSGGTSYMKYTMLSAHRKLKSTGQKIGASAAVCHLRKLPDGRDGSTKYWITVSNVGMVQVVLSRNGQAIPLTHCFSVNTDRSECIRIQKSHGIITEDGRVNGITECTRLLGSGYLFPQLIPKPHVKSVMLQPDDQFIIIANHELWKYVNAEEAVKHIITIHDPVMSAKALQDLAQGYGASENLSIMVINLAPTQAPHIHALPSTLLRFPQFGNDALGAMASKILHDKVFRGKGIDGSPLTPSSLRSIVETNEDEETPTNSRQDLRLQEVDDDIYRECGSVELPPAFKLRPLPTTKSRYQKKGEIHEWDELLQQRLAEEVKNKELDKELQSMIGDANNQQGNSFDSEANALETDSNWSTLEQRVLLASAEANNQQDAVTLANAQAGVVPSETSTESPDEDRLYDIPVGIDRDAILFYKMQMARINSGKTGSLNSVQSDPMYASLEEIAPKRVPSHSIEVLVRAIPNLSRAASSVEKRPSIPVAPPLPPLLPPPLPPPPPTPPPPIPELSDFVPTDNSRERKQSGPDFLKAMTLRGDSEIVYTLVDKSPVSDDIPPEANLAVPYITLPQSWTNQPPLTPTPTAQGSSTNKEGGTKTPSQQSIIISYL